MLKGDRGESNLSLTISMMGDEKVFRKLVHLSPVKLKRISHILIGN